ncbi:MAG: CHAT domain-containing protein [Akkermansiaceae bacterium]|nr:CHAT domain-containing protein [Akkermansiaceae bacterium]
MIRTIFIYLAVGQGLFAEAPDPAGLALRGEFVQAGEIYLEQAGRAKRSGNLSEAIGSLMNAAGCLKMSGDITAAGFHADLARQWMGEEPPKELLLEWLALKGSVLALGKRPEGASDILEKALRLSEEGADPALRADLFNDLGISYSSRGAHTAAMKCFDQAAGLASGCGDLGKLIRARQNHLVAAFQAWADLRNEIRQIEEVRPPMSSEKLPQVAAKAELDASLAAADEVLATLTAEGYLSLRLRLTAAMAAQRSGAAEMANRWFGSALEIARASGDPAMEASALMGLAEQYGEAGRHAEALLLLAEARSFAQNLPGPEQAKLEVLTAESRHAIAPGSAASGDAIRRAVAAVEGIRSDLARTQMISDLGRGFREFAGRPYLLLADHLLRASGNDGEAGPARLREARDAIESFKTWELDDFYRDDCVNLALSKSRDLDRLGDPAVAILYIIPLDVIAPAIGHLRSLGVKHLVFVADGSLGNIPLGVLYDPAGKRFLIKEFSVSIAPGISLLGGSGKPVADREVLAAGLSEAVQGFPAIPAVLSEIRGVARIYPSSVLLENAEFTAARVDDEIKNSSVGLVHLASHGEFTGRAGGCFLLTHDGRITLDDIEGMIRPKKFTETPVDLLCLSGCRTAAGDDRAALGLAGAGVKAGVRSVVASLWYVEDSTTAELMSDFHRRLRDQAAGGKAAALRGAQLELLKRDPNAHPSLWAPFILIGEWR